MRARSQSLNVRARLRLVIAGASVLSLSCVSPPSPAPVPAADECCFAEGLLIAERYRVRGIESRRFTANEYWGLLAGPIGSPRIRTERIGASVQGRPLTALHVGTGPVKVLAWSQMHGDESAASMGLLDLITWLASEDTSAVRDRLLRSITLTLVPVLNPDGAELFQRHNAIGVDINRDARRLATPEGRALKGLHDRLEPEFGFNLHDQSARNTAGVGGKQVGIALLAPAISEDRRYDAVRSRARLVAARMAARVGSAIPGQVAMYDDAFNPRAFGDLIQTWGTSTVLIESGALANDPQKQRLRALNVAALVDAFIGIGEGSYRRADRRWYDRLPPNRSIPLDLLIRGASVVGLGPEPYAVDIGITYVDAVMKAQPRLAEVGDLSAAVAIDTVDATGLYLHPAPVMVSAQDGRRWMRIGNPAEYTLRRGPSPESERVAVDSTGSRR